MADEVRLKKVNYTESTRTDGTSASGEKVSVSAFEGYFPEKPKYDENGNIIITYALNGETFVKTANRIGLKEQELAQTNPKAAKNGWFRVGEAVAVSPETAEKVNPQNLEVDPKKEETKYEQETLENIWQDRTINPAFKSTEPVTLDKNTTYWELAKKYLKEFGNEKPSDKEISKHVLLLQGINNDKDLTAGVEVKLPITKFKEYPRDKYSLECFGLGYEITKEGTRQSTVLFDDGRKIKRWRDEAKQIDYYNYYNTEGKLLEQRTFSDTDDSSTVKTIDPESGKVIVSVKKDKDGSETIISPLVEELDKDVSAKKWGIIPTTRKSLESNIKKITPEHLELVLQTYKKQTGRSLVEDIDWEIGLSKKTSNAVMEHLQKSAGYDPNYHNPNSQIKNENYTGRIYDVKTDKNVVTITNKSTGKQSKIDIDDLLYSMGYDKDLLFRGKLQNLPGEVLEDMSVEVSKIWSIEENPTPDDDADGYYDPYSDDITVSRNEDTIVHELGHAVDNTKKKTSFSSVFNQKLAVSFQREMKAYIAQGGIKFEYDKEDTQYYDGIGNYCTANIQEMVAESYTLMMLGDCDSKETILNHFPETFALVKEHIANIRKLPAGKRH
ncbi:MAG: hypothetical protein LBJ74_04485 [Heliobacteriaceae bacterium]|jgi:hypothetical protein|nr:hypothetical protein [Heliobacteriaceae bacterium]